MVYIFQCLLKDEFDNDVDDGPCAILTERIESMCTGTHTKYPNTTWITMMSGESVGIRMPFEEAYSIWQTCIEPININQ